MAGWLLPSEFFIQTVVDAAIVLIGVGSEQNLGRGLAQA